LSSAPAVRAARERFTFDVVPATNPDGIVLGACMVNAVGQYIFYDAGEAAAGRPSSAETAALWRLVSGGPEGTDAPAAGYLEYHSTFHTGRPSMSYVVAPDVFADPGRREVNDRTSAALRAVGVGRQIVFARGRGASTGTLLYLAAERHGTAAHLFKTDTGLGPVGYHAQVVEALERFTAGLIG
jgi:hypothetical protein